MTFELSLLRVGVAESGRLEEGKRGNNLISATLLYPSSTKATSTTVKAFKLKDDQTIDLTGENPATGAPFTYGERVIFKEELLGESELVLEVTDVEQPTVLDKVITGFIGAVFKGAWALATGGISNVVVGAVVGAASGAHLSSLSADGAKVRVLGRASVSLDSGMQEEDIDVSLIVPEDIELTQMVLKTGGGSGYDIRKVVIKKGSRNGRVIIRVRRIA